MKRCIAVLLAASLAWQAPASALAQTVRTAPVRTGTNVPGMSLGAGTGPGSGSSLSLRQPDLSLGSALPRTVIPDASVHVSANRQAAAVRPTLRIQGGRTAGTQAGAFRGAPGVPYGRDPLRPAKVLGAAHQGRAHEGQRRPSADRGLVETEQGGFAKFRKKVLGYVRARWELPLEDILEGSDVILLGENHGSLSAVRSLASDMARLKASGVTHVGIEGLKVGDQADVDRFLDGETDEVPVSALRFSPRRADEFAGLLKAARKEGVRVTALGRPLEAWASEVAEDAAEGTGDPVESFGKDLGTQVDRADRTYEKGFNEAVAEVVLGRRNRFMADRLQEALAQGGKAVALLGSAHVAHPAELLFRAYWLPVPGFGDMAAELGGRLLKSFSITLTGGLFTDMGARQDDRGLLAPLYRLLSELRPDGAPGFVRTSESTGVLHLGGHASGVPQRARSAAGASVEGAAKDATKTGLRIRTLLWALVLAVPAFFLFPSPAAWAADALLDAGFSPSWLLLTAVVLPFAAYLVPALIKSHINRRSQAVLRLARSVHADPDRTRTEGDKTAYVRERSVRRPDGGLHLDRFILSFPSDVPFDGVSYRLRGGVTIESYDAGPASGGGRTVERLAYRYSVKGEPVSGEREVFSVPAGGAWKDRVETGSDMFLGEKPIARTLLGRWAPHESGKALALAAGLVPGLAVLLMAGLTVHPAALFVWTGAGMLAGITVQWWKARSFRSPERQRRISRIALWTGIGGALAAGLLAGFPTALGLSAGVLSASWIGPRLMSADLDAPDAPAPRADRRSGSWLSKFSLTLAGLLLFGVMGAAFQPKPVSANDRAALAASMETGAVGSRYAEYLRSHPGVPVYYVMPWHFPDMSGVVGRHWDADIRPFPRVQISAQSYGGTSRKDLELSLSTLVHELDHDRQEEETGGVPTTLEHEYTAWEHQAVFILEQFQKEPELFKPGGHDARKREMLERAKRWLDGSRAAYRANVKSYYPEDRSIEEFKGSAAERWKKYYREQDAALQAVWDSYKDDQGLKDSLKDALEELRKGGDSYKSYPELEPSSGEVRGAMAKSILSVLALLGLGWLPAVRRRREDSDQLALGTPGAYTRAFHRRWTNPRIKADIEAGRAVRLAVSGGRMKLDAVGGAVSPETVRLIESRAESLGAVPGVQDGAEVVLLEPEAGSPEAAHPHLLVVTGEDYQVAHAGTFRDPRTGEPAGRFAYMTSKLFTELPDGLLESILREELGHAEKRFSGKEERETFGRRQLEELEALLPHIRADFDGGRHADPPASMRGRTSAAARVFLRLLELLHRAGAFLSWFILPPVVAPPEGSNGKGFYYHGTSWGDLVKIVRGGGRMTGGISYVSDFSGYSYGYAQGRARKKGGLGVLFKFPRKVLESQLIMRGSPPVFSDGKGNSAKPLGTYFLSLDDIPLSWMTDDAKRAILRHLRAEIVSHPEDPEPARLLPEFEKAFGLRSRPRAS